MFNMGRTDVLPVTDLAVRKAFRRLYGVNGGEDDGRGRVCVCVLVAFILFWGLMKRRKERGLFVALANASSLWSAWQGRTSHSTKRKWRSM